MKKLFARGLVALLPMIVTITVVWLVVTSINAYVAVPIGESLRWLILHYSDYDADWFSQGPGSGSFRGILYRFAPWIGIVVGFVLVFVIGALVATFFGKRIGQGFERVLSRLPLVNVVYPYAKQFTEFFSPHEKRVEFKNAVAIPFPSQGLYSIGFITSEGLRQLNDHFKKHLVCVFVPAAPTTVAGHLVFVPREEVIPLTISVDEAVRLIVSCGVLTPPHQTVSVTDIGAPRPPSA